MIDPLAKLCASARLFHGERVSSLFCAIGLTFRRSWRWSRCYLVTLTSWWPRVTLCSRASVGVHLWSSNVCDRINNIFVSEIRQTKSLNKSQLLSTVSSSSERRPCLPSLLCHILAPQAVLQLSRSHGYEWTRQAIESLYARGHWSPHHSFVTVLTGRHIPAKTSLKSKNGTDYNQREHFQFNELRNIKLSK